MYIFFVLYIFRLLQLRGDKFTRCFDKGAGDQSGGGSLLGPVHFPVNHVIVFRVLRRSQRLMTALNGNSVWKLSLR